MLTGAIQILPVRTIANRKSFNVGSFRNRTKRGLKTYSKKKSTHKSPLISPHFGGDGSADSPSEDEVEQEPLIRLGEGFVVDWDDQSVKALMDGLENQGVRTYENCATLEDPQLEKKKENRMTRRKNGVSLSECLDEFGKEEVLSEMDTWYCPRCKEHRRASKKLELWKTPDILILHFKRFSSTSHRRDKLDVRVDFPIEGLDMTKRIVESDGKEEVYDLFAVDNHYGSLGGGHYTACAKSFVDGEWYDYNDSSVSKIKDLSKLITPAAYLLFYRRRSGGAALGGPRFQEIIERMKEQEGEEEEGSGDDEQGNGQRLGVDSPSRNGSSSALRGVGQTVPVQGVSATGQRGGILSPVSSPPPGGLGTGGRVLGMGVGTGVMRTGRNNIPAGLNLNLKVNSQHIENLPDYQSALNEGAESARPEIGDAALNDGIELKDGDDEFVDEGIDMGSAFDNAHFLPSSNLRSLYEPAAQPWSFASMDTLYGDQSGTPNSAAEDDDVDSVGLASDIVDNGSDASDGSIRGRLEDFENAEPDEDYREATPPPDLDDSGAAGAVDLFDLSDDIVAQKIARVARATPAGFGQYEDNLDLEIPMKENGEDDEPEAMEIHVEEGEGLGKL